MNKLRFVLFVPLFAASVLAGLAGLGSDPAVAAAGGTKCEVCAAREDVTGTNDLLVTCKLADARGGMCVIWRDGKMSACNVIGDCNPRVIGPGRGGRLP